MIGPIQIPDYASPATRRLAEALNNRIAAVNATLDEARGEHGAALAEVRPPRSQAVADADSDSDDLLSCPLPDEAADDEEIRLADQVLRAAEVACLRTEIGIRRDDVPAVEAAIRADHAAAVQAVEKELAGEIARLKNGLRGLGLSDFVDQRPQVVSQVSTWHAGITALRARQQALLSDVPPKAAVNEEAVRHAYAALKEWLHPRTQDDIRRERAELLARSARASLAMVTGALRDKPRFAPEYPSSPPVSRPARIGESRSLRIGNEFAELPG